MRRRLNTSLYRGKNNAHAFGHFKLKKRLHLIKSLKDLKNPGLKIKGLVTRLKYRNPAKGLRRKRYYPRNLAS